MKDKLLLVKDFVLKNWFRLILICLLLSISISLSDIANNGIEIYGDVRSEGNFKGDVTVEGSYNGYPIEIRQ